MEYLLVVYFLMSGVWVHGSELEGWGPMTYPTEAVCLERKLRAEQLYADLKRVNPRAIAKRFVCEPRETGSGGSG
jgi:hypothetical protein